MTSTEILTAVATIREYTRIQEEAAAIISAAQDAIKAHMDAAGLDTLTGTDYKITWRPCTRSTFDKAAAEALHPGIVDACSTSTTYRRFLLK